MTVLAHVAGVMAQVAVIGGLIYVAALALAALRRIAGKR